MTAEIKETVTNCTTCQEYKPAQKKEPMIITPIPNNRWQIVSSDLFSLNNKNYLITVDHFSDYFEVSELRDTNSCTVIEILKQQFATHGVPCTFISDNGPQYSSSDFVKFCKDWGITHKTSSPLHSQGKR